MNRLFRVKDLRFLDIIEYPLLEIEANQATFLCGESGSGKSTLLQLLSGVLPNTQGEILYQDKGIEEYDPIMLRREVLLCSQTVYLFDKTILENFHEYYDYRDLPHLETDEVRDYLHVCCLDYPLSTHCSTMSGGERHRVFIAICLSLIPKVLMLDEPTSALDEQNANKLMENLKAFCKKRRITLLVVCHDKSLANKYADRTIQLKARANK